MPPFPMAFRLRLGERFEPRDGAALPLDELETYFRKELCAKELT